MAKTRLPFADRMFRTVLCCLVLYLSFRYPLQINFSGTSPTYSDTPPLLQAGKYLIALGFCTLVLITSRMRLPNQDVSLVLLGSMFIAMTCVVKFAISGEFRFIEPILWPSLAAILCLHATRLETATIEKYILRLFTFALVTDVVQVTLFLAIDRLPALAYEDSISVRFGSFLDDPNGFSGLCFLFIGWAIGARPSWRTSVVFWGSILMILLAQSLTSIGFLVLVLLVVGKHRAKASPVKAGILAAITSVPLLYFSTDLIEIFNAVLEYKQGSISTHTKHGLLDILPNGATQFLFGSNSFTFYESWWNLSLSNFGVLWSAPFMILGTYTSFRLFKEYSASQDEERRAVFCALLVFSLFFMFGSFNLPLFVIFPNSFIFYCIAFMSLGRKIQTLVPITQTPEPGAARKRPRLKTATTTTARAPRLPGTDPA